MSDQLTLIHETMDAQLGRTDYPDAFPALPQVPASRYFDPGFAQLERTYLWNRSWLLAGLETELPAAGSYVLFEKLDNSVIISRGKDGEIRAFHNVCRHRASALLLAPKGKAMRFVCPYHAWGYDLEGKLKSVPDQHDFACLDKAESGLIPVRCETWRGLIFINFDENAGPLAEFMAPVAPETDGFPLEKLVVKDHFFVPMETNWKTAYHNFLEIYHVNTVHAKSLAPYLDSQSFVVALYEGGHSRFATRKRKGESIFKSGVAIPAEMGELFKECTIARPTFPNTFFALDPIGFTLQCFWPHPTDPDKSIMEIRLVGWEADTQEDRDYWSAMHTNVESILAEDLQLFASIQRGLKSGKMPKVTFGYQERALYWFEEEIDRRIGAENIPEAQRIVPMLGGHVTR
jgi:phenylpropionate dioxygenase-like ring-hydroxylating dioxygenase large terminal subunit